MRTNSKLTFFTRSYAIIFLIVCGVAATAALAVGSPQKVQAAQIIVEPLIIDHQGLPRDIIRGSFKLTNPNHYKTTVYSVTKNFDPETGTQEFVEPGEADHANSLANWISASTIMIELAAGETKTIPYEIEVNLRAKAGAYHAVMFFVQGLSRSEAETQLASAPQLIFNVTVGDDSKDRLQVGRFSGPGTVIGSVAKFVVTVNNTGNTTLSPSGEIRIYNRNGQEVAAMPVNSDNKQVASGAEQQFEAVWNRARGFGRYKAQLVLEFGDKQFQTYQDSIYFRLLPWPVVLFVIMILTGVGLLLVYAAHRAHITRLQRQEEHYQKLLKQKVRQAKQSAAKRHDQQNL